jgi:ABC-type multidrug transport system fused ATPase/permease subunit
MAKDPREKENNRLEKAAKKERRKQTRSQMWQAFQMQRKKDKKLIPFMLLGFLVPVALLLVLSLVFGWWWLNLIVGIFIGALVAFWIFSRRLQAGVYDQIEGEAGAAGWALQNLRDGVGVKWITETAVATNTHMDAVHRVVGVPGIVLVGEGSRHRLRPMMAQERKRLARILGNTPIYDVYVGKGEDEVEISKLQNHMVRLPRNIKKNQVDALNSKVESISKLHSRESMLPKGPVPRNAANPAGVNRRARRAANRNKRG